MIIKGRKPQAYDSRTQETNGLLIPAASIDFPDQENLEEKTAKIVNDISSLRSDHNDLSVVVDKSLTVPKQVGTLVYNGKVQRPVLDRESSRFSFSGDISAVNAGTYTATVHLDNGTWSDPELEDTSQQISWKIEKRKIPKPVLTGTFFENGDLQGPTICGTELEHIRVEGQTTARSKGNYNILVFLKDPDNVTWEDGTILQVPLTWTMYPKISQEEIDLTELEANVTTIKSNIVNMKLDIESNSENIEKLLSKLRRVQLPDEDEEEGVSGIQCVCTQITTIESLKRRIEMIETLIETGALGGDGGGGSGNVDIKALIAALTRQVEGLETQAADMTYDTLAEESEFLLKHINNVLLIATLDEDISALNALKARVQAVYQIKQAQEELRSFAVKVKQQEHLIDDLLSNGTPEDIKEAKKKIKDLRNELEDILVKYSEHVKNVVKDTVKEITDMLDNIAKKIAEKEATDLLGKIKAKMVILETKINNGEDVTDLISEIETMISDLKKIINGYSFPFIRDELTTIETNLARIKKRLAAEKTIKELSDRVKALVSDIGVKRLTYLETELQDIKDAYNAVKLIVQQVNDGNLTTQLNALKNDIDDAEEKILKYKFTIELDDITTKLNRLQTEAEEFDPSDPDPTISEMNSTYTTLLDRFTELQDEINGSTIDMYDKVKEVKDLFKAVRKAIDIANIKALIYEVDIDIEKLRQKIIDLDISYEDANTSIAALETRLAAIKAMDRPEETETDILDLEARIAALRSLNEDSKIYREVKPVLISMWKKIYDEDLNVLWTELNAAKTAVSKGGNSDWIIELKSDIAELENVLNRFSGGGENEEPDFEGLLNRFQTAVDIIISIDKIDNDITSYDEAKVFLELLDKAAITLDDTIISIDSFYSFTNKEKYYLLENTLRKIRRKVLTTEYEFDREEVN